MKIILFIILIIFILNFGTFLKIFKSIKRKTWIVILLIFFFGLIIRLFIIPYTHHVYFDELDHINIAQNILYSNKFCECFAGSNQNCEYCHLMPWPPGYHTFLSLSFHLFGDSEQVAFNTNAVVGSVSVILIFLLIFLLFKNSSLALLGAFMFSFIPVHLKYSGSSSLGIFSVFFVILCLILLEIYIKSKKHSLFLLFLFSLLYTVQIRPENFLLIFIFSFYLWIKLGKKIRRLFSTKYLVSIFIFLVMLIPLILLIYYSSNVAHSPGWDDSLSTRINYLKNHFIPNLFFFIDHNFNSIMLPIFFLLGCITFYFKDKKQLCYYGLFFLLFLIMYSSYHIGHMTTFGDSVRYSLIFFIPLIIVSIKGVEVVLKNARINRKVLILLIILIFLISLFPSKNFIFSKSRFNSEYEFILSMKDKLPSDVYIISYSTVAIISTIHKKSITPHSFIEQKDILGKEYVILFKDFWWYERLQESKEIEDKLKEYYSFQLIEEDSGYGFYNLTLK